MMWKGPEGKIEHFLQLPDIVKFSWSVDLSAQIAGIVREESPAHYKHVVVCMIGSRQDQPSIYLGSRCLWNEVTDSFTSIRYS